MILIFKKDYKEIKLKVFQFLKTVYGLGLKKSKLILIRLGVNYKTTLFQLKKFRLYKLHRKLVNLEKFFLDDTLLNRELQTHYNRVKIGSYKGIKLNIGLPVNGQSTRTNAKTFKRLNRFAGLFLKVHQKIEYEKKKLIKKTKRQNLLLVSKK